MWFYESPIVSIPAVVEDTVVVHVNDPNTTGAVREQLILGINRRNGSVVWTREGGLLRSFFEPTTDGRLIYTAFADSCLSADCISGIPMALNPANGSVVWTNENASVEQTRPPIVVQGRLFYDQIRSTEFGLGVVSLDPTSGEIQYSAAGRIPHYSLTVINNGVAIRSVREPTFLNR